MVKSSITVVIPHYEAPADLERALSAIISQTFQPEKVVVVDDASEARVFSEVERVVERVRASIAVDLIRLAENGGPALARNRGWEAATGEYVAFLDADDAWVSTKLEVQQRVMEADKGLALTGHRVVDIEPGGVIPTGSAAEPELLPVSTKSLLVRNEVVTSSVMLRREVASRFAPGRRYSEDYELWLRVVGAEGRASVLDSPLAVRFKRSYGESGLSSRIVMMEAGELRSFFRVYRDGFLPLRALLWATPLSLAKFMRRVATVATRRARGRLANLIDPPV